MSCRLRSFQSRENMPVRGGLRDPRALSRIAISGSEGLPARPPVRDGRGGLLERGAITSEASEEERDMTIRAWSLTVLLSALAIERAAAADYAMELDAPATTGREATFDAVLRGTSDAQPALGIIGFASMINYDPQVLSLDAHSFAGTVFEASDFALVTDDASGTIVVVVIRDQNGTPPPATTVVPPGVGLAFARLEFRAGSCAGSTNLSFGGGVDDNLLVDENLIGHDPGGDLELNGATIDVEATGFIRGNADGDALDPGDLSSSIDMADGLFVIDYLFKGGAPPPCLDAADANDDGRLNLLDPIWIFQFLLGNDAAPALSEPYTMLDEDPTDDTLGCVDPPETTLCDTL